MIVADAYTATVDGVALGVREGTVSIDASRVPHVTAQITISRPSPGVIDLLDPRDTPRVTVTASTGIPRPFDLGVRGWSAGMEAGTLVLELASDEKLLEDYAPLVENDALFSRMGSLRDVVDYVLDAVIPGAHLEAAPSVDADVTVYADATNLITNTSAQVDTAGWGVNVATLARYPLASWAVNAADTALQLNGSASNTDSYIQYTIAGSLGGKRYRLHARQQNYNIGGPSALAGAARVYMSTDNGRTFGAPVTSLGVTGVGAQKDHGLDFTAPPGVNLILVRLFHGFASTDAVMWADVMLHDHTGDPTDTGYWDGDTPDSAVYRYDWSDTPRQSRAVRVALVDRPVDALRWQAGQSAMQLLMPLVQAQGLRLVCDEQRLWTLRDESYTAPSALALRTGVNIIGGDESITRDAGYWFDARVTRYRWTDRDGIQQERSDAYALTAPYTRLSTLDIAAPYPGPGRSEYAVRRAQGLGREISATAPADWSAHAEQPVSVILADTPIQIGLTQSVEFDLATGRMRITTRTTDTPAGAIDLLTGTVNALTGTVNAL